eukprot:309764_1
MSSFSMRLCSPTSTSKQIEVAMKFSGQNGIVLQMNNPQGILQYKWLHGFNVSWVSRFKEEDERLFFGAFWPIQIQSIRIRSTKQNFEKIIRSLLYLDVLVTGGRVSLAKTMTAHDLFVIECLINGTLNPNETKKRFDDYIGSTFEAFTRSKKQIVLNLKMLDRANKQVTDLFMNPLDVRDLRFQDIEEIEREDDDLRNLCKPQVFEIFKNVQTVVFLTADSRGDSYSISMSSLLSLMKLVSLDNVILRANRYRSHRTWIDDIWYNSSEELTNQYGDANYNIDFQKLSHFECQLMITTNHDQ